MTDCRRPCEPPISGTRGKRQNVERRGGGFSGSRGLTSLSSSLTFGALSLIFPRKGVEGGPEIENGSLLDRGARHPGPCKIRGVFVQGGSYDWAQWGAFF